MIKYVNKIKEVDLNKSYKIIRKPIVTEKATKLSSLREGYRSAQNTSC